jgi:hypothetical protein
MHFKNDSRPMKTAVASTYLLIAVAAILTVLLSRSFEIESAGALVFITAWLTFPHLLMTGGLVLMRRFGDETYRRRIEAAHLLAVFISVAGVLWLAIVFLMPTDAQGAFGVLLTPIGQVLGFCFCLVGLMFVLDS